MKLGLKHVTRILCVGVLDVRAINSQKTIRRTRYSGFLLFTLYVALKSFCRFAVSCLHLILLLSYYYFVFFVNDCFQYFLPKGE